MNKLVKYSYNTNTDFSKLYECIHNTNMAECSKRCNHTMYNPLVNLAKYHQFNEIELYIDLMIKKKFSITNQDHEGNTVLHFVENKPELLIRLLFHEDYKKCIFIKNKKGDIPIHTCAHKDDIVNLFIFIQNSPDEVYYVKNHQGFTLYDIVNKKKDMYMKKEILCLVHPDIKNLKLLTFHQDILSIIAKFL